MRDTRKVCTIGVSLVLLATAAGAQTITEIIDSTGDGSHALAGGAVLSIAVEPAVEGAGNVYVAAYQSHNAFKITPEGGITQIIDSTGDGTHNLYAPRGIAVDSSHNVFVTGWASDNAFKIEPGGRITQIIDSMGDDSYGLEGTAGVTVDSEGAVYVTGRTSDNAFRIDPGGNITQIIGSQGDGLARLDSPYAVAVDSEGNAYVAGYLSDNAFKIEPDGTILEIIDITGDGVHVLRAPSGIAVDGDGNVFVAGANSNNAFRIGRDGTITQVIDTAGDGVSALDGPSAIAAEPSGMVYVSALMTDNAFKITPEGTITEIIDGSGDGTHAFASPWCGIAAESSGIVYVAGRESNNAFRITPEGMAISSAAGLIVPGFEVAVDDPGGPTTLFAARNTTSREVLGVIDYFGPDSTQRLRRDPFVLAARQTLTRNVRDDLSGLDVEDGRAHGFIVITQFGQTTAPDLVGDYFRVDSANDFACGDRMVRSDDLCLVQEVRYVDFGSGSRLRILVNRPRGDEVPSFAYRAYDEAGTPVASGDVTTSCHLATFDVSAMVEGQRFGTLVFDFANSGGGWVSAEYSAFGRYSLELNSACRDE